MSTGPRERIEMATLIALAGGLSAGMGIPIPSFNWRKESLKQFTSADQFKLDRAQEKRDRKAKAKLGAVSRSEYRAMLQQSGTFAWLSGLPITANPHPAGSHVHQVWAQA